jgi:CRISPR-associated protein Csx14
MKRAAAQHVPSTEWRGEGFVATLGQEPQVVTLALDCLLQRRHAIGEVVVVHTIAPTVVKGLRAIEREFVAGYYPAVTLRAVPVESHDRPLDDFRTEDHVQAAVRALYVAVRDLKRRRRVVHLCVAGGRKVMSIAGMVVAQLLFGPDDRVWHLLSEQGTPGAFRRMHTTPGGTVVLVPVPVLRWTDSAVMLAVLAHLEDPAEALRRYEEIVRGERMRRRREFVERWLTPAERQVVQLACQGLDNVTIACRLGRSQRTVANQLTAVYGKLQEWLGFAGPPATRPLLLSELVPYFELVKTRKSWVGTVS